MRVLSVTQAYYPYLRTGGPAAKVRALAEGLAGRGHEVCVVTDALDAPSRTHRRSVGGVDVVYLGHIARYRNLTLNPGIVPFALRRVAGVDVAHIYGTYDLLGPAVALACRARGVPYVVEPMGMYRPIVRSLAAKRVYRALLGRWIVGGAARVVATSELERRELVGEGIGDDRVVVRRNGVDLDELRTPPPRAQFRAELGVADSEMLIVYLGRVARKKGLDLLVDAFASTAPPAALAIVGPDEGDGTRRRLEQLIGDRRLAGRVRLLPGRYGVDRLAVLSAADLFVLPSHNENFGNAAAEAVACGTPALVTRQCGIAPLLDSRAGLVVDATVEGLRDGLRRLVGQPLLSRLREGCAAVAKGFSWEEPLAATEQLYREIVIS